MFRESCFVASLTRQIPEQRAAGGECRRGGDLAPRLACGADLAFCECMGRSIVVADPVRQPSGREVDFVRHGNNMTR